MDAGRLSLAQVVRLSRNDVVGRGAGLIQASRVRRPAVDVLEGCVRAIPTYAIYLIAAEVGMVEQVEEVHAELDAQSLTPYPPVLVHREVGIDVIRPAAKAASLNAGRIRPDRIAN